LSGRYEVNAAASPVILLGEETPPVVDAIAGEALVPKAW
jgi:hypothetical protein